jgi:hypothetical protein
MYESFTIHFHRHLDGGANNLSTNEEFNAQRMLLSVSSI